VCVCVCVLSALCVLSLENCFRAPVRTIWPNVEKRPFLCVCNRLKDFFKPDGRC
jgi:hypothetical protein